MSFIRIESSKRSETILMYITPELKAKLDERVKIKKISRNSFIIQSIKNELSKEK